MAIFDKDGKYIGTEDIGCEPEIINDAHDFRERKLHIISRMPDRLRNIATRKWTNLVIVMNGK